MAAKPRLEAAHEELSRLCKELAETSAAYQRLKAILTAEGAELDLSQFEIVMTIPGTNMQVPVPAFADQATMLTAIEGAASGLGSRIIDLWALAHQVTAEAYAHCQQAAQAAAADEGA